MTSRSNDLAKPKRRIGTETLAYPSLYNLLKLKNIDEASPRIEQLSKPKKFHRDYRKPRRVPPFCEGYRVKKAGKNEPSSSFIDRLATPKKLPEEYVRNRDDIYSVAPSALTYQTTSRILTMSEPHPNKTVAAKPCVSCDYTTWLGPQPSTNYVATWRTTFLSEPKRLPKEYRPPQEAIKKIHEAVLTYEATDRIKEISKPNVHPNTNANPNAFQVSAAAKHYKISDRLEDLSKTNPLKQRVKFTGVPH